MLCKNHGKKTICLLLTAVLLLAFTACGAEMPEAGRYTCVAAADGSYALDPADLYPEGAAIELGSGGRGVLSLGERSGTLRWSLSGTSLTLNIAGERFSGTLEDGVLDLTLPDSGVLLRFVRDDMVYIPAATPEPDQMTAALQQWEGDWYGIWTISNAEGDFADTWYDCCAVLEAEGESHLVMTLWDEDTSRSEPMGRVEFTVQPGKVPGAPAAAVSTVGSFWFEDIEAGQWVLDTRRSSYPDMLRLRGHHEKGESFDYEIVLRPWGRLWDDVAADDPDLVPFRYAWYQDLIERGAPMPENLPAAD